MTPDRDSAATKQRLLDAATEEFAAHGIAGARVDRIATAARANKQLIYAYFGDKDGLFEAVLAESCGALIDNVVFDPEDLPGYAGRLFDYVVKHPEVFRLDTWAGLERPAAAGRFEVDAYRAKLDTLAAAQHDGRVDASFAPADLLALVLGVTGAWFSASDALRTLDAKDPWSSTRLSQFRDAAVEAVKRLVSSPPKRRHTMSPGTSKRTAPPVT